MKTYIIIPTNEGQELNYSKTFTGSLNKAKARGKELRNGLKLLLRYGTIGCIIQNEKNEEFFLNSETDTWVTP